MNITEMAGLPLKAIIVVSGPFVIHVLDLPHDVLNVVYVVETKRMLLQLSADWGRGGGNKVGSGLKYTKPPLLICGDNLVFYHINIVN